MRIGQSAGTWAAAGILFVFGLAAVKMRPDSDPEHLDRLSQVFRVPDGAGVLDFTSEPDGYRRNELAAATLQLTPEQYHRYVESFEDTTAWTFRGFTHDDVEVEPDFEPGWNAWHQGYEAFLVNLDESPHGAAVRKREKALRDEPVMVIRWARTGFERPDGSRPPTAEYRSMCWAYGELDGVRAVRSCKAYNPASGRPLVYGRAMLDDTEHILSVLID